MKTGQKLSYYIPLMGLAFSTEMMLKQDHGIDIGWLSTVAMVWLTYMFWFRQRA